MSNSAKKFSEENYKPQYVTKAFQSIKSQAVESSNRTEDRLSQVTNGLESKIDFMTLVQLPARRLKETVTFYIEVLGFALTYPERAIERNVFVQTQPKNGPSLHILETPQSEFRHLHRTINDKREEYVALYVKNLGNLHERLLQAGTKIVAEPVAGYMSFLDPEEHPIGVYERTDSEINDRVESNTTGFRRGQVPVQFLMCSPA